MSDVDVGDDIGDPTLEKVLRFLAGWGVPALVTGAWVFLALTSDASTIGKVLMGVGLAVVLALWSAIRTMTLHAALARAIAVGIRASDRARRGSAAPPIDGEGPRAVLHLCRARASCAASGLT